MYERGCLGSSSSSSITYPTPSTPAVSPASTPYTAPSSSTEKKKQYTPYNANGESDEKKPYSSPSDNSDSDSTSESLGEKKTHHFFRYIFILVILAGVGFVWHKRRREDFNYQRFRQMREARNYAGGLNVGGGGDVGGDYTGVSMSDSCSFEPPTLPPTPNNI